VIQIILFILILLLLLELFLGFAVHSFKFGQSYYSAKKNALVYQYDPQTGYTITPNLRYSNPTKPPINAPRKISFVDVRTDKNGFLFTGDLEQASKEHKLIFCLGGSTTMGVESRHDKTYPASLDKLVQPLGYRCINSGIGGGRSIHELLILKHKILRYKPKILILFSGYNDYESYSYQFLDPNDPFKHYTSNSLNLTTMKTFFDRSCLLYSFLAAVKKYRYPKIDIKVSSKEALYDLTWLKAWTDNVGEIIDLCKKHEINFFLLSYASPVYNNATWQSKEFADNDLEMGGRFDNWLSFLEIIHEASQKLCDEKLVQFIDVRPEFEEYLSTYQGDEYYMQRYRLFADRAHFTEEGNQLLAKAIFCQIKEKL
jgi:lysophospholipase L1-like esterase